jgi:hypothetical protein
VPVLFFATAIGEPTVAWAQWNAPAMTTEIWMSSGDVALCRRSRANYPQADADNEQFARSMLTVAEKHLAHGDKATAKWLTEWAQRLTNDRANAEDWTATRRDAAGLDIGVAVASRTVRPLSSSDPTDLPAKTSDDQTGRPSLAFVPSTSPWRRSRETAHPVTPVTSPRDSHPEDRDEASATEILSTEGARPAITKSDRPAADKSRIAGVELPNSGVEVQVASRACLCGRVSVRDAGPPRSETAFSIDDAERLVAAAARNPTAGDPGGPFYREPPVQSDGKPVQSDGKPITLAVISFAAGIVSCAAVCIALCFVPFRSRLGRRANPTMGTASEARACQTPGRAKQEVGSRIVEEFFDSNVELYRELAKTG